MFLSLCTQCLRSCQAYKESKLCLANKLYGKDTNEGILIQISCLFGLKTKKTRIILGQCNLISQGFRLFDMRFLKDNFSLGKWAIFNVFCHLYFKKLFLILTQGHFFIAVRERNISVRDKHRLVASHTHLAQGLNPRPSYVP